MIRQASAIVLLRQPCAAHRRPQQVWLCQRPAAALVAPGYTTLLMGQVAADDAALLPEEQSGDGLVATAPDLGHGLDPATIAGPGPGPSLATSTGPGSELNLPPSEVCAWRLLAAAVGLWPHHATASRAATEPRLAAARRALLAKEGSFLPMLTGAMAAPRRWRLVLLGVHDAPPFTPTAGRTTLYVLEQVATAGLGTSERGHGAAEPFEADAGPRGIGCAACAEAAAQPSAAEPQKAAGALSGSGPGEATDPFDPGFGPWGDGAWHDLAGVLERWQRDELLLAPLCAAVLQELAGGVFGQASGEGVRQHLPPEGAGDRSVERGPAKEAPARNAQHKPFQEAAAGSEWYGHAEEGAARSEQHEALKDAAAYEAPAIRHVQATLQAPRIEVLPVKSPTLPPSTHTNCYLLGGPTLAVVDPGTPYDHDRELLLNWLAARVHAGGRLEQIWLTHHHEDHIGAAMAVRERFGAKIYAHAHTAAAVRGRIEVDHLVADDQPMALGGQEAWRALFTPGHAAGHLCFYESARHHLLSGDNVLGTGTSLVPPLPHGSVAAYNTSLRRILALPLGLLLPGHGPPSAVAAARIASTLRQREAREAMLISLLAASKDPVPLTLVQARLYRGLAPSQQPLAMLSMQAHLDKLIDEGKAAIGDDGAGQLVARWLQ